MRQFLQYLLMGALLLIGNSIFAESKVTIDFTTMGYENAQEITTVEQDSITLTFEKGTNTNSPKYYTTGTAVRCYSGNTVSISATKNISRIDFVFSSGEGTNDIIPSEGRLDSTVWIGSSQNITLTIDGTKGHRRFQKMEFTFEEGIAASRTATSIVFSEGYKTQIAKGPDDMFPEIGSSVALPTATVMADSAAVAGANVEWSLEVKSWKSKSEGEQPILNNGRISFEGYGVVDVKATYSGNDTYQASSKSYTLTVYNSYGKLSEMVNDVVDINGDKDDEDDRGGSPVFYFFRDIDANGFPPLLNTVTYVNGKYIYLTDGEGNNLLFYGNNTQNLKQGDKISGNVGDANLGGFWGNLKRYNKLPEFAFTDMNVKVESEGNAVVPTTITVDKLAENINAYVKMENAQFVSVDKKSLVFMVDETELAVYNQFGVDIDSLEVGATYTLTGMGAIFNTAKQLYLIEYVKTGDAVIIDPQPVEPVEGISYSWESPAGEPIEWGGTIAYVNGDGNRLNYAQASYFTICLNGKKAYVNDETASANAGKMVITLDKALAEGDTIAYTAYINKDASKKASAYILFENGTDAEGEVFSDEANIDSLFNGVPTQKYTVVPAEAAGSKTITLTRSLTGTNLFITKLQIIEKVVEEPVRYAVTVAEAENGSVVANPTEAAEGETVTLIATPAEGYMVDEAHVIYGEGQEVGLIINAEANTATFTMPAATVNVIITFKAAEEDPYLVEIAQDQGIGLDDFSRTELVEGDDYNTYTCTEGIQIAFKMFDIDVKDCDYVILKFAEPVAAGWELALWGKNDNSTVSVPEGATEYKYVFAEDAWCAIVDDVLPQITMLHLWTGTTPLVAKVSGIYKHKVATIDPEPQITHTWDFTKWSEATVINLKVEAAKGITEGLWSDQEKADGSAVTSTISVDNCFWQVGASNTEGETLTANGEEIVELKGLLFKNNKARSLAIAVNYGDCTSASGEGFGPYHGASYLWLGSKYVEYFTIPAVKAGTIIKMGVESHKNTDARGVKLLVNGIELTDPEGNAVAAPTAYTEQTWQVPAGDSPVDIVVMNTNGCHIYFIDAEQETKTPETSYTFEWVAADQGYENMQDFADAEISLEGYASMSCEIGSGKYTPKYYDNGMALRFYAGNTMTFRGYDITKIVITCDTTYAKFPEISASTGEVIMDENLVIWTGNSDEVAINVQANQLRMLKLQMICGENEYIGKLGDVNNDDEINITDVVLIIDDILQHAPKNYNATLADVNKDGQVDVSDVVNVIDAILGKIELSRGAEPIDRSAYTAFQMDLTIPAGYVLESVSLTDIAKNSHSLAYAMLPDGRCRVVVCSMNNEALPGAWDEVISLNLRGKGDAQMTIDRAVFVTIDGERHELMMNPTSIAQISNLNTQTSNLYDLQGRKVEKNAKGILIENGKKTIRK